MIKCFNFLLSFPEVRMILQVHDELILEGPRGFVNQIGKQLANLMQEAGEQYGIPTPVNMTLITDNWAEGKEIN